jgi:hypothetical protein
MKLELTQHFSVFLPRDKERVEEKVREKREKKECREWDTYSTEEEREREGEGQGGMKHVDYLSIK